MKLQVLVAAVNANVQELAASMNLQTEAIIVNQCDEYSYREFVHQGRQIRCFSMAERGVGLSRNTALMRSEAEWVLFSDEDICLEEGYEKIVLQAFAENPDADVILFNVEVDPARATFHNTDRHRVRWYNYGRYGLVAAAARRETLIRNNLSFSLLFGGGAKYSAGEDSLFLRDCLKAGLHLYSETARIGREIYRESTWFQGYNEKFFFDRGVLYSYLYGGMAGVWALRFLLAKRKTILGQLGFSRARKAMRQGIAEGRQRRGRVPVPEDEESVRGE